jgi:hypothetical protein
MSTARHEHRTAGTGPGSGGCRGSTPAPVGLPARSYGADSGPAGPAGRGRGPVRAPARAGSRRRSPAGPEHIRRARCARAPRPRSCVVRRASCVVRRARRRKNSVVETCRPSADRARTIGRHQIPALRSVRAFSAAAPIVGAGGGCPGSVPGFFAPPFWAGVLFCNTPLSGALYPPLDGGVPPLGGVSAPFSGHIGLWTTNGQPMDNQQTTNRQPKKHGRKPATQPPH